MSDQDNLRDRIAGTIADAMWRARTVIGTHEDAAQAIIDDLHLESYPFTRHDGHTTTHVHGWMEPRP